MTRALTVLAVCLLMIPCAFAKDDADALIAKAQDLAKAGSASEAAQAYAAAMKAAQKAKDLQAQERVQRSLERSLPRAASRGSGARGGMFPAMLTLAAGLDAKRNGVFLSRGSLSHWCILEATRSGDRARLDEACKAAIAHARIAKSGAYAKTMASYAKGLQHAEKKEYDKACPLLQAALAKMVPETWAWTTVLAATETAAAYLAAGEPDKAKTALDKGRTAMKASGDRAVAQVWRAAVQSRLAGAAADVLEPYEKAMEPFSGGGSVSAAGGAGAPGAPGGVSSPLSKLGAMWDHLSKKKPFIRVTRTAAGYVIRQAFDTSYTSTQPFATGVKHHQNGGVTLSFWDGGVRLYMLDMRGLDGAPGESSQPSKLGLFFPLAVGETWGVNKRGDVTITSK